MREILFRAKSAITEKWVIGYFYCPDILSYVFMEEFYADEHIIPETLGQYTGLLDKNGKKIFEGDIVKGRWKSNKAIQILLVRYKNGCFVFDNNYISGTYEEVYDLQVIGNSYDNLELI